MYVMYDISAGCCRSFLTPLCLRQERETELAQIRSRFQKAGNLWKNKEEASDGQRNRETKVRGGARAAPRDNAEGIIGILMTSCVCFTDTRTTALRVCERHVSGRS